MANEQIENDEDGAMFDKLFETRFLKTEKGATWLKEQIATLFPNLGAEIPKPKDEGSLVAILQAFLSEAKADLQKSQAEVMTLRDLLTPEQLTHLRSLKNASAEDRQKIEAPKAEDLPKPTDPPKKKGLFARL